MTTLMVIFVQSTFVVVTVVHIRNINAVTDSILTNFKGRFLLLQPDHFRQDFCTQNLPTQKCLDPKFFGPNVFLDLYFFNLHFLDQHFLRPNFFLSNIFLDPTLLTWIVFGSKYFGPIKFLTKTTTTTTTEMVFDTIEISLVYLSELVLMWLY